MEKRQRLVVILAVVLALAVAVLPDLLGRDAAPSQPEAPQAVVQLPADEDEGEGLAPADEAQASEAPSSANEAAQAADPEAPPATQEAKPAQAEPSPTATVPDDGIKLDEGITDARAQQAADAAGVSVQKGGSYTSKVEVALYIHTYGRVPDNYITKTKARNAGWVSSEGNLWDVCPGKSIGGGGYMNEGWGDEPLLPETPQGRDWRECDINYQGGYRGAERLVYSDDGLVFYTGDHYETFERLY